MRQLLISTALVALAVGLLPSSVDAAAPIKGTLTAMSGTTLPAVLTVHVEDTAYTVNVTATTKLLRKSGGRSSLDEFGIMDELKVEGTTTGTTVDATKVVNLNIRRKGGIFWGKIKTIDGAAKSFTIDPSSPKKLRATQTVKTSAKTGIFQGNRVGEFTDLTVGMIVKVIGARNSRTNTVFADRILIKLTELNGTVKSVDCASAPKQLTVQTKKGKRSTTWTVNLTDKTVIRDKNLNQIACTDVKVGHRVHVRGLRTGTTSLNALIIWDRGAKKTQSVWNGTIESIDVTAKTFVLEVKGKKGGDVTVVVTVETILVNENGSLIAFADLMVDHKAQVRGTKTNSTVTGNFVVDASLPGS